jgi:hypothetical protein
MSVPGRIWAIDIRLGSSPGKTGVNHYHLSAFSPSPIDPFHRNGMVFCTVAAGNQEALRITHILPGVGHSTATK